MLESLSAKSVLERLPWTAPMASMGDMKDSLRVRQSSADLKPLQATVVKSHVV